MGFWSFGTNPVVLFHGKYEAKRVGLTLSSSCFTHRGQLSASHEPAEVLGGEGDQTSQHKVLLVTPGSNCCHLVQ